MKKYNKQDKIEAEEFYIQYQKALNEKKIKFKDLNYYIFDELYIDKCAKKYYQYEFYYQAKMLWKICLRKINQYSIFDFYIDNLHVVESNDIKYFDFLDF